MRVGFVSPFGIGVTGSGLVYVADQNRIYKVLPDGTVTTFAGNDQVSGSTDGWGSNATVNYPFGVCFDKSGAMYVADNTVSLVREIVLKHPL